MKISRAIKELEAIQANNGDIEICLFTDQAYRDYDGSFIPLDRFSIEDIHQAEGDDEKISKAKIVSLGFHECFIQEHE